MQKSTRADRLILLLAVIYTFFAALQAAPLFYTIARPHKDLALYRSDGTSLMFNLQFISLLWPVILFYAYRFVFGKGSITALLIFVLGKCNKAAIGIVKGIIAFCAFIFWTFIPLWLHTCIGTALPFKMGDAVLLYSAIIGAGITFWYVCFELNGKPKKKNG